MTPLQIPRAAAPSAVRARPATGLAAALVATLALLLSTPPTVAAPREIHRERSQHAELRVVEIADGLDHPWGLAFLPDGDVLVTERGGALRRVSPEGRVSAPIAGVPRVHARGQGGLLDVALGPQFATDGRIFLSYAEPAEEGARTAVASARLEGERLDDLRVVFRQRPAARGSNHFGSRLVFDRDGLLFVTLGDRFDLSEQAQEPSNHIGKIVRIRADGSVPPDNPFTSQSGAAPELWSIGHRNVQGAALNPQTGQLWTAEHGPRGGDEINTPKAGRNYGWPVISYGTHYSGAKVGVGTAAPNMEQPLLHWTPSIAPSGLAFYQGDRFVDWRGNAFVGALRDRVLVRLVLDGERVVGQERLLTALGRRIRAVREGPDGLLYLLTDERDGTLLRVEPAR